MNASGKSSLMKAIGIATLLAQAGCYVPATSFRIAPFRSLLTRILNQDNLWAGLSSFAVEMSELRDIFAKADPYSLVLGDELCSGTESVSATSLVAAGIQYLTQAKSRFVFATHLHGLHKLADFPNLGVWHLQCHYDIVNDRLVYDRTLHKGAGTTLYGIEVARAMHIPVPIVEAALAFRRKLEGEVSYSEATSSHWNASIVSKRCEKCGSPKAKDLEVHHVKHRADAVAGRFEDGSHQNNLRNLAVLCEKCHDDLHAGLFEIGPVQQTSDGEARSFTTVTTKVTKTTKDEKRPVIEKYLREHPNIPLKRIVHAIQINENMVVSEAMVRAVRKQVENA
jgi:DNA mismatch repair protein MutS